MINDEDYLSWCTKVNTANTELSQSIPPPPTTRFDHFSKQHYNTTMHFFTDQKIRVIFDSNL